jgi:integrase
VEKVALVKRGKTWHTDFVIDGQRFRQSLHTSDWRKAQSEEKKLIEQAVRGQLRATSAAFARLLFEDAAEQYLDARKPELSESSQKKERQLLVKSKEFFRGRRLKAIEAEDILAFRQWRSAAEAGPAIINMEVGVIRRILRRAKRWSVLADDIKPLREPRSIGRAMSLDQKLRLLSTAGSNEDWENARLAMTLALCTTMRGVEIRNLRWQDIDFLRMNITVRRSKTDAGHRTIPMNDDAYNAVLELRERAKKIKAVEPGHFLFPACEHGHIDPTKPVRSWRTSWRKLTQLIQCPACRTAQSPGKVCRNEDCKADIKDVKSPLAGLRFHDLRHHAITELAESQASDSTIMALAGHVSRRMLEHYSHIRQDAKREAVGILSAKVPQIAKPKGYDTNRDTNQPVVEKVAPQVIENMVGTRRLELLTSTVSR